MTAEDLAPINSAPFVERPAVLIAEHLGKRYRTGGQEIIALQDVNLRVRAGEFIVLLGPSGSGKSTLLNILGGLDRPSSGRAWFAEHDLSDADDAALTRYRREHVGFVFQFYNLMPSLTVRENVQLVTDLLTEDAAALPVQASATLTHWGGEARLPARLSRIEPGAFTKVSALGVEEQRVKAVFDWQNAPPPGLGDGYKMEIRIAVQQAQGVPLAPVSAVFPHGQGHAVFTIDEGRARLHPVTLLGRNGQQAWLRTDLPEGSWVVA